MAYHSLLRMLKCNVEWLIRMFFNITDGFSCFQLNTIYVFYSLKKNTRCAIVSRQLSRSSATYLGPGGVLSLNLFLFALTPALIGTFVLKQINLTYV